MTDWARTSVRSPEQAARLSASDSTEVLFPFTGTLVGGSYISSALLARGINELDDRYHVTVTLPRRGENAYVFECRDLEPHYYGLSTSSLRRIRHTEGGRAKLRAVPGYFEVILRARRVLARQRPALVHVSDDRTVLPWGLAARTLGIPVVWHVRMQRARPLIDRIRLSVTDQVILVADAIRTRLGNETIVPEAVVHNPVETDKFRPEEDKEAARKRLGINRKATTIVFVGNLVRRKRPEWALRAVADLLDRGRNVQLIIVGKDFSGGSYGSELRDMTSSAGVRGEVLFMGFRRDVDKILRASDVLVLASRPEAEAFPRVILEAMASGLTVVATCVAGVPEAVEHERTGLLCEPGSYESFLLNVERAVDDASLRNQLGTRARAVAETRFAPSAAAQRVTAVYDRMLSTD